MKDDRRILRDREKTERLCSAVGKAADASDNYYNYVKELRKSDTKLRKLWEASERAEEELNRLQR